MVIATSLLNLDDGILQLEELALLSHWLIFMLQFMIPSWGPRPRIRATESCEPRRCMVHMRAKLQFICSTCYLYASTQVITAGIAQLGEQQTEVNPNIWRSRVKTTVLALFFPSQGYTSYSYGLALHNA